MTTPLSGVEGFEQRFPSRLLDVLIRAALLAVLVVLCYQIFAPFVTLMAWALILAVAMFPIHQRLARRLGGKQGRASILLVLACVLVILTPTALLLNSFGDSLRGFVSSVQQNTLQIPAPRESVKKWPVVGPKVYDAWTQAHENLPGFVQKLQPKAGDLAKKALATVAGIGVGLLLFLAALVVSGILMAYGEPGTRACRAILGRVSDPARGEKFAVLATATIRTVMQGVLGVAFIQSLLLGLVLMVARVPWAGVFAAVALVFAIAQLPTIIVTVPAIAYLWMSGHYGTVAAVAYTVLLLVAGIIDNVLKPLLLGRGVDAPMPVILLGALGGMASDGILGMFVGATVLALGYQIFMSWVAEAPAAPSPS